ncbi:MAG: FAD-binding oxidoreductase, partial [Omnitrophica WOR_2 bacterium]
MQLSKEFINETQKIVDLRVDIATRFLYSTDASIYQIEPLGVAFPKNGDQLAGAVELAAKYHVPVLARGAGSSLAGQAIGEALILDCSRYMDHIIEINPEERIATVETGVVLNAFNKALRKYGLQFGPDPASAERATIGGSLANNATGAHSIQYGMAADHLIAADIVLSDGSITEFRELSLNEAMRIAIPLNRNSKNENTKNRVGAIYASSLRIREQYKDVIREKWPKTWRNASGYGIHYLLPWSPSFPPQWGGAGDLKSPTPLPYPPVTPGTINLAPLLCGSEGTLAIIRKVKVRLVPRPQHTVLAVIPYEGLAEACDAVPGILELNPSAIELIPRSLISLAHSLPAYARHF